MAQDHQNDGAAKADALVAEVDTGARNAEGFQGQLIIAICIIWSLFQLYIASKLPGVLAQYNRIFRLCKHRRTSALHPPRLCDGTSRIGFSNVQIVATGPHSHCMTGR